MGMGRVECDDDDWGVLREKSEEKDEKEKV